MLVDQIQQYRKYIVIKFWRLLSIHIQQANMVTLNCTTCCPNFQATMW